MRTHPSAAILPFLVLVMAATGFGQQSSNERISATDSGTFFLYIDYCGNRYNKSIQGHEMVINIVKLPGSLLKKMPRLKDNGQYSSRNRKISAKQQEILKKCKGETMIVRVNKNRFKAFYPKGLKKGFIIESDEFNRWNFMEKPAPYIPPLNDPGRYRIYWHWNETDPVSINYGLMVVT